MTSKTHSDKIISLSALTNICKEIDPTASYDMRTIGNSYAALKAEEKRKLEEQKLLEDASSAKNISEEYGFDDHLSPKDDSNAYDMRKIQHGKPFTFTTAFDFRGTFKDFQENPERTTYTIKDNKFVNGKLRPIINKSEITAMLNTCPVPINFQLMDFPTTHLVLDAHAGTHEKATYQIPPNLHSTSMSIGQTIYARGGEYDNPMFEGTNDPTNDFSVDETQWFFHDVDHKNIESSSIESPLDVIYRLNVTEDPKFPNLPLHEQEEIKSRVKEAGESANASVVFVKRQSVLGKFISSHFDSPASVLTKMKDFPDHYMVQIQDAKDKARELREVVTNSPLSKVDGIKGFIRPVGQNVGDNTNWLAIDKSRYTQDEIDDLMHTPQHIYVSVRHSGIAYQIDDEAYDYGIGGDYDVNDDIDSSEEMESEYN